MRRAVKPERVELYPITLREKLPPIPVPLRGTDPGVTIELQPLLDRACLKGRYALTTDYGRPSDPPLDGEDEASADELLRAACVR